MYRADHTFTASGMHPSAGTYSHAVRGGGLLFVSGQAPLDIEGNVPSPNFRDQAELALDNLERVILASGASFDDVVRLGVYLTSLDDFPTLNEVMLERFRTPFPARTTLEVKFPKFLIEIDAVVALGGP